MLPYPLILSQPVVKSNSKFEKIKNNFYKNFLPYIKKPNAKALGFLIKYSFQDIPESHEPPLLRLFPKR